MSVRKERFWHWLAQHLPRILVYWCGIVLWANATRNPKVIASAVTMDEILKIWEGR